MVIHRLGELKVRVPLSLAQGIPGLLDAVPVTSPPVVEGSGTRSSAGSPQQAERTRVEERLQVSTGGSGSCPLSIVLPPQWRWSLAQQGPSAIPAGTGPKGEKGEKGERGPKGDSGTSGILGTGATKGEKVSKGLLGLPLSPVCSSVFTFDSHLSPFLFHRGRKVNWASR